MYNSEIFTHYIKTKDQFFLIIPLLASPALKCTTKRSDSFRCVERQQKHGNTVISTYSLFHFGAKCTLAAVSRGLLYTLTGPDTFVPGFPGSTQANTRCIISWFTHVFSFLPSPRHLSAGFFQQHPCLVLTQSWLLMYEHQAERNPPQPGSWLGFDPHIIVPRENPTVKRHSECCWGHSANLKWPDVLCVHMDIV